MTVVSMSKPVTRLPVAPEAKKIPTLYETDARKYAGPHRWQIHGWAKLVRRLWHARTYTRWVDEACESMEVKGLAHLQALEGPCVFVANHQSHLDTLVLHECLPQAVRQRIFYAAAQDRWYIKGRKKNGRKKMVLQPWYQSLALGNFPLLRGGGKKALSHAHWLLAKGQHVFLFPEGTRATGSELGEFKHGAGILALQNNVPVVPVYLAGLQQIRPKGNRNVVPGQVTVEFLPPILFSPGSDLQAATECVRRRMNRVHARYSGQHNYAAAA